MGTYLRVLIVGYPMNTHMTWFRGFSKIFASLCFGCKYSLSIGRVNIKFTKYLIASSGLCCDQQFSFKYFSKSVLATMILLKQSGQCLVTAGMNGLTTLGLGQQGNQPENQVTKLSADPSLLEAEQFPYQMWSIHACRSLDKCCLDIDTYCNKGIMQGQLLHCISAMLPSKLSNNGRPVLNHVLTLFNAPKWKTIVKHII